MTGLASPIRTLLIGRGLGGTIFHAPLITALPQYDLIRVAGSGDAAEAIADERIELVVISTPNPTHFPLAKKALDAGRHVVVDKPFTTSVEQADALVALAAQRGTMLSVFHNRRWDGDYRTVRSLLGDGRLGDLLLAEMHWDRFRPSIKPGWKEVAVEGVGLLFDLGPHLLDQALQLFGAPRSVTADIAAQRAGAEVDDYFDVRLDYDRLRVRVGASSVVCDPRPRFALHGTKGSFVLFGVDPQEQAIKDGIPVTHELFGIDERRGVLTTAEGREIVPTERGCYLDYYRAVAAAIRDGMPPPVTPVEARQVQRLLDLARRSARDGRTLTFAEETGFSNR